MIKDELKPIDTSKYKITETGQVVKMTDEENENEMIKDEMKEVTYEDWMKNPTPRMMWVWDDNEESKKQEKVVYFINADVSFPVVIETVFKHIIQCKHCAEIEKQRRMTNKELSRWLREKPHRELKCRNDVYVYGNFNYIENEQDEEVDSAFVIREDDGEWREPLVEVEE